MLDFVDCFNRSQGWCSVHKMENMWREMWHVIEAIKPGEEIVAVELGVFAGRSLIPPAHLLKERRVAGRVYGIDPWATHEATKGYGTEDTKWWSSVDLTDILKQAHSLIRHYHLHDHVTLLTSTSNAAAALFSKIHYFHCDGQHFFEQFKQDVDNYVAKCVPGAAVIIDDVNWCGGTMASEYVERFCTFKYSVGDCSFYVRN